MSRYLITLKPEKYQTPQYSYAVLAEVDWASQELIRQIRFPSASYGHSEAYHAPLIGGVCTVGERVFVAIYNAIIEIDYTSFQIVNSISHPYMVDLHGMATNGQYLYVASTGIDAVLCFDINTFDLVWRWGPDVPILYKDRLQSELDADIIASLPVIGESRRKNIQQKQQFRDLDYRHMRKGMTGYHHHHLNDVILRDDTLYITTKQWNNQLKGAVIQLDLTSNSAGFFIPPDSVKGLHDGVWIDDTFYMTESGENQVVWRNPDGTLTHYAVEPSPYFVRGLCDTGASWLVGFSTQRDTGLPAQVVEFSRDFTKTRHQMDVSFFYPSEKSTAIHSIMPSPEKK